MEWQLALIFIFGSFIVLLLMGVPVAFAFLAVVLVGAFFFMGGQAGLRQALINMRASVCNFTFIPLPLFILMGEVMFRSGVAFQMMDALDKWLGRVPGRLGLLAVAGGTVFATLSGSSVASVAMLGSVLAPEMEKRGYKKSMSLGPILGSGGLAVMIPPTAMGVILACLMRISVGHFLIAIIIPGVVLAAICAMYIILRCYLQPSLAPPYAVALLPLFQRVTALLRYVVPLGSIIFLVVGLIFIGVATPSEAAAAGALGCFILAGLYRGLNWKILKEITSSTLQISVMIFMILSGAYVYSQLLAYTGATRSLAELVLGLPLSPIVVVIVMQLIVLVMGMFMEPVSIAMIVMPIYLPVLQALGIDLIWFGVMMLINMEIAVISPPFGLGLYVMKGVAPPDTTMVDVYLASLPFIACHLTGMALIMAFPNLTFWLPGIMR